MDRTIVETCKNCPFYDQPVICDECREWSHRHNREVKVISYDEDEEDQ